MAEPFLSEIRMVSFNFPPRNWALCNGQFLLINQNQALFSLLGTNYGGDGRTFFALPDLRSRVPLHMGSGLTLASNGGEESHRLTTAELAAHTHSAKAYSGAGDQTAPIANSFLAVESAGETALFSSSPANDTMSAGSIGSTGGGGTHENRQPYLTLSFCIALQGIFPSQT